MLETFKANGYCYGDADEMRRFQQYCFRHKIPYVSLHSTSTKKIRLEIALYRGLRFTPEAHARIMRALAAGSTPQRLPSVSPQHASANLTSDSVPGVITNVMEILRDPATISKNKTEYLSQLQTA